MSTPESKIPGNIGPADLWERLVGTGMPKEDATAQVERVFFGRQPAAPTPEIEQGRGRAALATGLQGVTLGTSDEIGAAVRALPRFVPGGESFGEAYGRNVGAARAGLEEAREEFPVQSALTEAVGALAAGIASGGASGAGRVAALVRKPLLGGALGGAAYGAGTAEGGVGERAKSAALGGALGGVLGGALSATGRALRPLASTAVDVVRPQLSRAGGAVGEAVRRLPIQTISERAGGTLARAMDRAGIKPSDLAELAQKAKPGETIMDVASRLGRDRGRLTRTAAGAVAGGAGAAYVDPGESPIAGSLGALAGGLVSRRLPGNAVTRLARGAASIPSEGADRIGGFLSERAAGAGRRIADIVERRTGRSFENAVETVDDLIRQRSEAARPLYERAFSLDVADEGLRGTLTDLFGIDEFRDAYRAAQRTARLEGEEALPDLFRVGDDGTVELTRKSIPVRALDYMKQGLDELIESRAGSTNKVTRRQARALRNRLNDMLGTVDELVPEYAEARAAWAGPSRAMEVFEAAREGSRDLGLKRFSLEDPRRIKKAVSEMTDADRDFYRRGAVDDLRRTLERTAEGRDAAAALTKREAPEMLERLRALFDDEAEFGAFMDDLGAERGMAEVKNFVLGGSPTARIQADQADLATPAVSVTDVAQPGRLALRALDTGIAERLRGVTEATVDELAPVFTTPLDQGGRELIEELLRQWQQGEARGASVRGLLPRTAGALSGGYIGAQSSRERP